MNKTIRKSFRFSGDIAALLAKVAKETRRSQTTVMEVALIEEARRQKVSVRYVKGEWR